MGSGFTQEEYDDCCDRMKKSIDEVVVQSGNDSLQMAIATGVHGINKTLYEFQEIINPEAEKLGIKTKTLSDIFGFDMKLTVF